METSKVISSDKATVVIQINPQEVKDGVVFSDRQQVGGGALQGFFKAQPKAVGTVQIMTGVMVFLLGIVLTPNISVSVISGITYWGSFIYISAGSLSVAAQNKLHLCVVKASLGMNVVSAITAGISMILMGLDIAINSRNPQYYYEYGYAGITSMRFSLGITGVLLVFSTLQFIVSIFISAFACKASCNTDSTVVNVALNQAY